MNAPPFGTQHGARLLVSARTRTEKQSAILDPKERNRRIEQMAEYFDNRPNHQTFTPFPGVTAQTTDEELQIMAVQYILEDVVIGVFEHLHMKIGRTVGDIMTFFGLNATQLRAVAMVDDPSVSVNNYAASIAWECILEYEAYTLQEQVASCSAATGSLDSPIVVSISYMHGVGSDCPNWPDASLVGAH